MFKCIILVETFQFDAVIVEFNRSETQGLRVSSRSPAGLRLISPLFYRLNLICKCTNVMYLRDILLSMFKHTVVVKKLAL